MLAIDLPMNVETVVLQMAKQQGISAESLVSNIVASHVENQTLTENPFNFDLDSIQKSIESGFKPVPKFATAQELANWLGGDK